MRKFSHWVLMALLPVLFGATLVGKVRRVCDRGGVKRVIDVIYDNPATRMGCKVLYDKRQEGAWRKKILYQAQYEPDFCEEKTQTLVRQLESWGWRCEKEL